MTTSIAAPSTANSPYAPAVGSALATLATQAQNDINLTQGAPCLTWQKSAADGSAAATTAEVPAGRLGAAATIGAIYFVPQAALTGDPTNNATILIQKRTGAGAPSTVATITTTASMVAFVPVAITVSAGALLAGDVLTVTISKGGTGVVVPAGVLEAYFA